MPGFRPAVVMCCVVLALPTFAAVRTRGAYDAAFNVIDISAMNNAAKHLTGFGVNAVGQVVGQAGYNEGAFAFATGPHGKGIGHYPTQWTTTPIYYATGINDLGVIVGYDGVHAIYSQDGASIVELGILTGGNFSNASAVNNAGQIVGASDRPSTGFPGGYDTRAFLANVGSSVLTDLGDLGGGTAQATAINQAGEVAGYSTTSSGDTHAFLTSAGGSSMRDLGTLDGNGTSRARGVSSTGRVVGEALTLSPKLETLAFISDPEGKNMRTPGTLIGVDQGLMAINDMGCAVGYADLRGKNRIAVIVGPDGNMLSLSALASPGEGVKLTTAYAINNRGEIVAIGSNSHTYLLSPRSYQDCVVK